jgi:type VI secretion system protein ImpK
LTGENEHERESAGDPMPPDISVPEITSESDELGAPEPDAPTRGSRRFRAWGAAQKEESGPSFWHRASEGFKRLFKRPTQEADDAAAEELGDAESVESEVVEDESVESTEPLWTPDHDAEVISASPSEEHSIPVVEPPSQSLSFLHIPEEEEPDRAEAFDVSAEALAFAPDAAPAHPPAAVPADTHVEEPKEDLKFLWSASDESANDESANDESPNDESANDESSLEPIAEVPRPKRPSLFQRLFSRKPEPESEVEPISVDDGEVPDTDEHEIPGYVAPSIEREPAMQDEVVAGAPEELGVDSTQPIEVGATQPIDISDLPQPIEVGATQPIDVSDWPQPDAATLDEALPMDSAPVESGESVEADAEIVESEVAFEEDAPAPKRPGFFARLFGRKPAEPLPEPDVDDEAAHEPDAAEQLDAADEGFEVARSEFAPPEHAADQSFASVDDALPLDTPTFEPQPAVTEASFAPQDDVAPPAPVAAASDEHQFFGGNTFDFDTPTPDDRATMEVAPVADDRKTAEVSPEVAAHADEVERKTDEFEMVTIQEPAVSPLEGKTAEVPKVSIFKKLFSRTKEVTQVEPAVAPPPSANPTFLVQKFRTFYNEIVVYKSQKAELTAGFATAIVTSYDADLSPEQAANSLAMRLQQMLELQLAESSWMGGEIQELYPDAQYAMACLADEMLAHTEWPGQGAWGRHRLELTVFKTAASDLELFKRVDKLLKNGPQTTGTRDLARVYLLAIASGFKGKFRPFDLPRALADYRRRLYEFVYGGDALLLYDGERRIFPEAVSVTVAGKGVKRFSLAQQWAAILVLILVGYTVVAHLAWKKVSADLKDIAARVEQARNPAPPDSPNGNGGR